MRERERETDVERTCERERQRDRRREREESEAKEERQNQKRQEASLSSLAHSGPRGGRCPQQQEAWHSDAGVLYSIFDTAPSSFKQRNKALHVGCRCQARYSLCTWSSTRGLRFVQLLQRRAQTVSPSSELKPEVSTLKCCNFRPLLNIANLEQLPSASFAGAAHPWGFEPCQGSFRPPLSLPRLS